MKPRLSTWNIAIVGKWNVDILNPEWVAANVFREEDVGIDLVLDGMTTNVRYHFQHVTFVPKAGRVVIAARSRSEAALTAVEDAARALLQALPVTPVSAAGINFAYDESNPTAELLRNFNINDSTKLNDLGLSAGTTAIKRKLPFEDINLNFSITLKEDGTARMGLNYHIEESDASLLSEKIHGKILRYQDHSQSIVSEMYGLVLEDEEDA